MAEFKINGTLNTTKGVKTKGTNYILVSASGTATENATELQAAYTAAQNMSPTGNNRITIVASPGYYEFGSDFEMSAAYIDLVSLDGNRSIKIIGSYTILVTANDIYVNGIDTGTLPFKIDSGLSITIENCKGGNSSFGYTDSTSVIVSGIFINCTAGDFSFGGKDSEAEVGSDASGTFINCTAGEDSFGKDGTASGTFTNCIAGGRSFGGRGVLTGKLYYCRLTAGEFHTVTEPGITRLCLDGTNTENNQG
jgi:hypothetical protein